MDIAIAQPLRTLMHGKGYLGLRTITIMEFIINNMEFIQALSFASYA